MRNKMINSVCTLAIGAVLLGAIPVRAEEPSPRTKLAKSMNDIRIETTATRDQLKTAVAALDALTKQKKGDLKPSYDAFVAEVKKTHDAAAWTSSRVGNMDSSSKDYFGAWQTEVAGISNESLRKNAQKRLEAVRKSYDNVIVSLRQATVEFKPFLSDLDDVQKALANDTTPGGIKAIRGTAKNATNGEKKVNRCVSEAIDLLAGMEKALSSQAGN
jgi:hypothetical protein